MKKEQVYMAIYSENANAWDENEQVYLGNISWKQAVTIAKSQSRPTRLSNSIGYNNQGHYFQTELQQA